MKVYLPHTVSDNLFILSTRRIIKGKMYEATPSSCGHYITNENGDQLYILIEGVACVCAHLSHQEYWRTTDSSNRIGKPLPKGVII